LPSIGLIVTWLPLLLLGVKALCIIFALAFAHAQPLVGLLPVTQLCPYKTGGVALPVFTAGAAFLGFNILLPFTMLVAALLPNHNYNYTHLKT
jgi:hypothetical protein